MALDSQMQSGRSTPPEDLRAYLMNPNIPKSEAEHWAARRITELEEALSVAPMEAVAWREKVARIIDPVAWEALDIYGRYKAAFLGLTTDKSLAKADAILALIATHPEPGT
jgi:hypothetical protein